MIEPLHPDAVRHLVVHCSATPDDAVTGVADVHAMHLGFGWHGIGYHRVIARDGTVHAGRPEYWIGAHVYGRNETSLGVCLLGTRRFTDAQLDALEATVLEWRARYPNATVCGHRDFSTTDKTCPNFDVGAWCAWRGIDVGDGPVGDRPAGGREPGARSRVPA